MPKEDTSMNVDPFALLADVFERPQVFSEYTADHLWQDEHISQRKLELHLDEDAELASRPHAFIERSAEWMKWMHPMRTSRYLFSEDFNPWMRGVAILAKSVAKNRNPLPEDHPLVEKERELIGQVSDALENARKVRDQGYDQTFGLLYGYRAAGLPRHDR